MSLHGHLVRPHIESESGTLLELELQLIASLMAFQRVPPKFGFWLYTMSDKSRT